jgi:NDP-sugar pyrophosphorylase family protein
MEIAGTETAVVIAAGAGSRMRASAGEAHPKPAVLALGVPLIARVLWGLPRPESSAR